jgi:hypothetical protein
VLKKKMESMSLGNEGIEDYFTNRIRCTKSILPEGYRNIKRVTEVLNLDYDWRKDKVQKRIKTAEYGGREHCAEYSACW